VPNARQLRSFIAKLINPSKMPQEEPPAYDQSFVELVAPLDLSFRDSLLSMYRGESQLGSDGKRHQPDSTTKVYPSQGMWLYNFCLSTFPKATLEIGMAYGYSTLYFLAAIQKNGLGQHTAIDPFQHSAWDGIGLAHALAHSAARSDAFRFIEDRSDLCAADLRRAGSRFDLIFIDGNHRYDDVLTDFYLYSPLCSIGGHIVFDDLWMSSVQTVTAFVIANRQDFVELPTKEKNIKVFKKLEEDSRPWNHFRSFAVSPSSVP